MPRPLQPPLSLKGRALRWLAQREHTRVELERKLHAHVAKSARQEGVAQADTAQPDIGALLDELAAKGFLSDERAAESLLAGRGSRLGPLRLRQELQARGFGAELTAATLARARADELARAKLLWQRKFGAATSDPANPADPREAARQMRFLAARGFTAEVVARIVRGRD